MRYSIFLLASFALLASAPAAADATSNIGVLDAPLPGTQQPANTGDDPQDALREELAEEQTELEMLPRPELEQRAEQGERAAQITLAEDFAIESTQLAFAPSAANNALSDAIRWYSLAAKRGFPGAPSLDLAGVRFFPIRAQR